MLADDDGRCAIGEGGAFGRGRPGRGGERKGGDHGVARAADVEDLPGSGRGGHGLSAAALETA